MTGLKQLVESIVVEVLTELAPEAPKDASFGQYLFAPVRRDLDPSERQESNTPMEDLFFDALRSHYNGSPDKLGKLAADIKNMTDRGWYENILTPPEETVYRYVSDVSTKVAARILGTSVAELEKSALKFPGVPQSYGPGIIKPGGPWSGGSGISSWSTKLDSEWVEEDLTPSPLQPGQSAIILAADAGEGTNFFINPSGVEKVEDLPEYAYYQNEVIAYGPVQYAAAWVLTNSKKGKARIDAMEAGDVFHALEDAIDYY